MKRYCIAIFALSSWAWAGKVAVTIMPIVPPQCVAYVTNVEVDALPVAGRAIPFAKATKIDLAPLQLSQVVMGVRKLRNGPLRFQVKLGNAVCATIRGRTFPVYSPPSTREHEHFKVGAKPATVVLLLDLRAVSQNKIRPSVKRLNIAEHLDSSARKGSLQGVVIWSGQKDLAILTQ